MAFRSVEVMCDCPTTDSKVAESGIFGLKRLKEIPYGERSCGRGGAIPPSITKVQKNTEYRFLRLIPPSGPPVSVRMNRLPRISAGGRNAKTAGI